MSGLPVPQPSAADYAAQHTEAPTVRAPKPAAHAPVDDSREELRRLAARTRLLNFILENHRQRQLDAVRGLRSSGAE
ncbi:hypothetical protein KOR34_33190 [Posidoniimonas corsicana]|uniref:Uncharacterized protein n=1 Tax=Posidoniimonas corsicana TaxID=1938618 RepID=A0A5C5V6Q8_9BACT|nr:hypothetical protein [Posidoniimonas corsicana]TWT33487.1 hypothetical protein KOR34_33190 [Posidoniimonas corsicana]